MFHAVKLCLHSKQSLRVCIHYNYNWEFQHNGLWWDPKDSLGDPIWILCGSIEQVVRCTMENVIPGPEQFGQSSFGPSAVGVEQQRILIRTIGLVGGRGHLMELGVVHAYSYLWFGVFALGRQIRKIEVVSWRRWCWWWWWWWSLSLLTLEWIKSPQPTYLRTSFYGNLTYARQILQASKINTIFKLFDKWELQNETFDPSDQATWCCPSRNIHVSNTIRSVVFRFCWAWNYVSYSILRNISMNQTS